MQTLESLPGERYSPKQLAQTREGLTRSLQALGWQVEDLPFATGSHTGTNLVATWSPSHLQSRDPGQTQASPKLLVGAHYDTVAGSPGADDNGTGVAALLEIAHLYSPLALDSRVVDDVVDGLVHGDASGARLMLVFFDQEEQGLLGSLAFATPERVAGLSGAVILEMLGMTCDTPGCQQYPPGLDPQQLRDEAGEPLGDRGQFVAVVGDAEHPELLDAFRQPHDVPDAESPEPSEPSQSSESSEPEPKPVLPRLLTLSIPFKGVLMPDVMRSDHAPFWLQGLGAVMVTDTANLRNPHYHRPSDRVSTLDPVFFAGTVQRVVDAIARLTRDQP